MRRSAAAYQKFTEDEIRKANSVDMRKKNGSRWCCPKRQTT